MKHSELKKEHLFEIAKFIDNDFIGTDKTFTADRNSAGFYLTTNKCDNCSLVRVHISGDSIIKIERIADDVKTWKGLHINTIKRINEYLIQSGFNNIPLK